MGLAGVERSLVSAQGPAEVCTEGDGLQLDSQQLGWGCLGSLVARHRQDRQFEAGEVRVAAFVDRLKLDEWNRK